MKGSSLQSAGPHATRYVGREHAALRDVRGRGKGVMCRCSVCRAKVFARFLGTRPTSPRAAAGPMSRSRTGSCCTLWGHEVALLVVEISGCQADGRSCGQRLLQADIYGDRAGSGRRAPVCRWVQNGGGLHFLIFDASMPAAGDSEDAFAVRCALLKPRPFGADRNSSASSARPACR